MKRTEPVEVIDLSGEAEVPQALCVQRHGKGGMPASQRGLSTPEMSRNKKWKSGSELPVAMGDSQPWEYEHDGVGHLGEVGSQWRGGRRWQGHVRHDTPRGRDAKSK